MTTAHLLVAEHRAGREAYRRRVPMLVPGTARRAPAPESRELPVG